jgi:hypothetical protein
MKIVGECSHGLRDLWTLMAVETSGVPSIAYQMMSLAVFDTHFFHYGAIFKRDVVIFYKNFKFVS